MKKFFQTVNQNDEMKEVNFSENQTLSKLRDTLLPKLISGEVRVKEALEQVKQVL